MLECRTLTGKLWQRLFPRTSHGLHEDTRSHPACGTMSHVVAPRCSLQAVARRPTTQDLLGSVSPKEVDVGMRWFEFGFSFHFPWWSVCASFFFLFLFFFVCVEINLLLIFLRSKMIYLFSLTKLSSEDQKFLSMLRILYFPCRIIYFDPLVNKLSCQF